MSEIKSIGLPVMRVEEGEKRAWLPEFVSDLQNLGCQVYLESGYGAGMDFSEQDYLDLNPDVRFGDRELVYQQDCVLILRCPDELDLMQLREGTCLVSMLHYPTNPRRTEFIRSLGVRSISIDSIVDDEGIRLVENMRAVAWNGLEVAFEVLAENYPDPGFESPQRKPIQVTLMGSGLVGMQVLPAAIRYGSPDDWHKYASAGLAGVQLVALDYDTTSHEEVMLDILSKTDILVDATQRPDPSRAIIHNPWIEVMPRYAVLLDLSVDPYERGNPAGGVKGIEGMPHGNLDQYVFQPEDPNWDATVPEYIPSTHRRTAVSCYSWPGVHPRRCMEHYAKQLGPLMRSLVEHGYEGLSTDGDYYQRALYRASLRAWRSGL